MTTDGISPIGNITGYTGYNNYDPTMLAIMNGYSNYALSNPYSSGLMMNGYNGLTGINGYTGYNAYNQDSINAYLESLKQLYSAQNQIQQQSLQYSVDMHKAKEQANVTNAQVHDRTFFEKVSVDGDVQNCIREIYDSIRRGDTNYVAQKYYELKQVILNKYNDYYRNSSGGLNDKENLNQFISVLYSEIGGGYDPNGIKPDLRNDILTYSETPFENAMNTTFMGNSGHNKYDGEELLNKIHGTRINDAGSKANARKIGRAAGRAKEGLYFAGGGAAAGLSLWALGRLQPIKFISNGFKGKAKALAWIGALGAGLFDAWWQTTRT